MMTKAEELENASRADDMTVTAEGKVCKQIIEGVKVRDLILHTDDRGTVFEVYDPRWNFHEAPMVFSYIYTIRPGVVKGWSVHKHHDDRYCLLSGEMKVVLYDTREGSATFGQVQEFYMTERRRQLLSIPVGVWHADENIGESDCMVLNFPTIQYDHSKPDKYRLPVNTDLIPYKFGEKLGG